VVETASPRDEFVPTQVGMAKDYREFIRPIRLGAGRTGARQDGHDRCPKGHFYSAEIGDISIRR
jgi:hypothetical protein